MSIGCEVVLVPRLIKQTVLSMLANATDITILAPSNDAFSTFLQSPENQAAAADNGTLMALLSYHVLNGTVMSMNITSTPTFVASLLSNETYTNVTGGQRVGARLVGGDDGTATIISGLGSRSNVTTAVSIRTSRVDNRELTYVTGRRRLERCCAHHRLSPHHSPERV